MVFRMALHEDRRASNPSISEEVSASIMILRMSSGNRSMMFVLEGLGPARTVRTDENGTQRHPCLIITDERTIISSNSGVVACDLRADLHAAVEHVPQHEWRSVLLFVFFPPAADSVSESVKEVGHLG